ncbi:MAG: response regulator [Ghiorsea sp.]|nr:response regulator [Ghiorsea sp.]
MLKSIRSILDLKNLHIFSLHFHDQHMEKQYLRHTEPLRKLQQAITLIILDVAMPKMDGIEAAKHLRHINPDIHIIFVTGFDSSQTLNTEAISSERVILKPFKISLFSQVIQNTLYKKGSSNHEQ